MTTTAPELDADAIRQINREVVKGIAVRVLTVVGISVATTLITNAISKKLDESAEDTDL